MKARFGSDDGTNGSAVDSQSLVYSLHIPTIASSTDVPIRRSYQTLNILLYTLTVQSHVSDP